MAGSGSASALAPLAHAANHSWLEQLAPDPDTDANAPNKRSRQVKSGHYVLVQPTPLADPFLVIFSPPMADDLGLSRDAFNKPEVVRFFAGHGGVPELKSWATPYALSIYGQEMYDNCPFKNGNGYGDGRAISVAEVLTGKGRRWELQLKGAGTTPFCRGGDGRAVLRSSVREFLASEAMYNMGVPTTRALSLVASRSETVQRPWYSGAAPDTDLSALPTEDDPRLAHLPPHIRRLFLEQLAAQLSMQQREPDTMGAEPCAITCRVAPSFLRVGHMELFARRVRSRGTPEAMLQLQQLFDHLLFREYPDIHKLEVSREEKVVLMLRDFAGRLSSLMADWLRVGYTQGNFNSDNCLVGGRTMDYGPFGFIEKYRREWNIWVGGGKHFSFMNQPVAAEKNFGSLVDSCRPLLQDAKEQLAQLEAVASSFPDTCAEAVCQMWARKLGLVTDWETGTGAVFRALEERMELGAVDFTLLFRLLADVVVSTGSDEDALRILSPAFYRTPVGDERVAWLLWLSQYRKQLHEEGRPPADVARGMRSVSPKYVPREWMLVDAYTKAQNGDYSMVHELYSLFTRPYDEQPAAADRFFRRAESSDLCRGGTAFMSCSS